MFSIRSQIAIGVISSVLLTTIILVIAYKLMWFNGHMTLTLSITTMITSCLTLSICSIFINPLIQKIKQFNIKTKQFVNGEHLIDDDTFQSPREIRELNDSFNKMADEITKQMDMIKNEQQEVHAAYETLIKQANRLSTLFDDMTHVISLNTGRSYPLELIQLDQLLVNILQTYEQRIKLEHRSLEVNFCSHIDAFYQYHPPLERILTNLLDNALKFSNYGSRIDIIISENANNDSINIAIKDEGIGILPELQSRIFERTFRVEDSRNTKTGGSGLGLYIANELAQQIDASISVESELNVGTTMTLTLKKFTFS
ncbi:MULTISPECIES: sensor histidine kinase [Staphylococcus]|nr:MULTISPECIES: sensor histidine kinase [Staphylococcus]OFQ97984.1 two-component sensor histidine kinase [Staphylococcus sp. HMSC066C03]EFS18091.1 sensor histidine kinase SaeS [Staphylococcus capitis C87]MBC3049893.1 sensor histidine kinase [Staphylococcus capitis]MBC3069873.1 sensor histidine kinase [Staphylococcus capitis]MBC3072033.1 sensor histidine kinase [Staphylococcus capitis]